MLRDAPDAGDPHRVATVLARITQTRGLEPHALLDGSADDPSRTGALEQLRLWNEIADDTGRERILAYAREVAEGRQKSAEGPTVSPCHGLVETLHKSEQGIEVPGRAEDRATSAVPGFLACERPGSRWRRG